MKWLSRIGLFPFFECWLCTGGAHDNVPLCPECSRAVGAWQNSRLEPPETLHGLPLYAAGHYECEWARLVRVLKAQPNGSLPNPLFRAAWPYVERWRDELSALNPEVVVAAPGHPWRTFWASDLSAATAQALADGLGIPFLSPWRQPLSAWISGGAPQKSLGGAERRLRERGVSIRTESIAQMRGRRILVVDDVCATGATLGRTLRALRTGGAEPVGAFVLARRHRGTP